MGQQEDIMVSFGADSSAFQKEFKRVQALLKSDITKMGNVMASRKLKFDADITPVKNKIKDLRLSIAKEKAYLGSEFSTDQNVLHMRELINSEQGKLNKLSQKFAKDQLGNKQELQQNQQLYKSRVAQMRKMQPYINEEVRKQKDLAQARFDTSAVKTHYNPKELKMYSKNLANVEQTYGQTFTQVQKAHLAMKKTNAQIKKSKGEFAGWAMSIMFFGMALKRVFDTVWKSSTKTFNDVMKSVEGSVTGFMMLDGALKYLGFTAGAALEPIAMFLIPIIDWVSQWITENEKLFAQIVIGAGILGTFFTVLGAGVLAADGFAIAMAKVGLSMPWLWALIALAGISWKAFSETPEAWEALKSSLSSVTTSFMESFVPALTNLIQTVIPEFVMSWENIAWLLAWVGAIFGGVFAGMVDSISILINLASLGVNTFKQLWAAMTNDQSSLSKLAYAAIQIKRDIDTASAQLERSAGNVGELLGDGFEEFKRKGIATQAAQAANETQEFAARGRGFTDFAGGSMLGSVQTPSMQENNVVVDLRVELDGESIFDGVSTGVQRGS